MNAQISYQNNVTELKELLRKTAKFQPGDTVFYQVRERIEKSKVHSIQVTGDGTLYTETEVTFKKDQPVKRQDELFASVDEVLTNSHQKTVRDHNEETHFIDMEIAQLNVQKLKLQIKYDKANQYLKSKITE